MVRPEPKVAEQREARGKSYIGSIINCIFAFALTERKAMRSINPGCRSFVAFPWADGRLALQAAQVEMCPMISYLKIGGTDARSKSRGQTCLDFALREGGRLSETKVKTAKGGEGV